MDERSQERLNNILKLEPEALSEDDKVFLRARRSYLKKSQLEEYKIVLGGTFVAPQPEFTYEELLNRAKELGYSGKRLKRKALEQFIAERANNPFIS